MATRFYRTALVEIFNGTIDIDTDSLKWMLVDDGYVFDVAHTVVDNAANDATDPSFNEIVATNYAGGFAGAGRKAATISVAAGTGSTLVTIDGTDETWTAIGGATNDTVAAAILWKPNTVDTDSRIIAYVDGADIITNGTDVNLVINASGLFTVAQS